MGTLIITEIRKEINPAISVKQINIIAICSAGLINLMLLSKSKMAYKDYSAF